MAIFELCKSKWNDILYLLAKQPYFGGGRFGRKTEIFAGGQPCAAGCILQSGVCQTPVGKGEGAKLLGGSQDGGYFPQRVL